MRRPWGGLITGVLLLPMAAGCGDGGSAHHAYRPLTSSNFVDEYVAAAESVTSEHVEATTAGRTVMTFDVAYHDGGPVDARVSVRDGRTTTKVIASRGRVWFDDGPRRWIALSKDASAEVARELGTSPVVEHQSLLRSASDSLRYEGDDTAFGLVLHQYAIDVDLGGTAVEFDFWLDDDNLVRRLNMYPPNGPTTVITVTNIDEPVHVRTPPPSQVSPASPEVEAAFLHEMSA